MMRHVIHLEEFKPALPGARSWMAVQRAWDKHPERRAQLAASLRRFCRVVNRVVSRTALRQ